jgi:hypothetical protein
MEKASRGPPVSNRQPSQTVSRVVPILPDLSLVMTSRLATGPLREQPNLLGGTRYGWSLDR